MPRPTWKPSERHLNALKFHQKSKSYRDGSVMQACLSGSTRFNGRINNVEEITPSGRMATGVAVSPSHYDLLMISQKPKR
jgi:hypothetical protein